MSKLNKFFAAAVVVLGVNGVAFAGWSPILTLNTPAAGVYKTFTRIKTTGLKVEKSGYGCEATRINYVAQGQYTNGVPFAFNLAFRGQTNSGAQVFDVRDPVYGQGGTIYSFNVSTQYGQGDCVYTFYAKTIDEEPRF